ncbi:MAG: glycosyltransferase [Gracilimonas sp.]|uniref:glycosyltransferase n=1 Tax=Gracilimonas sp. TaxID=1974203 RepID=UPI0019C94CD1|nr:glycosyltransferase [Gracilimonas sp.]MBD3614989.1 glycosyltransferase [Gracilimonas sp.]
MKEKILYVGNFKLPDKNAAAHRVLVNSKILVKLGYEVILVGVRDEVDTGIYEHVSEMEGIQMYSVSYPKKIIDWIKFYGSNRNINTILKSQPNLKYFIGYNYQSLSFLKVYFRLHKKLKFIADTTEWYQPDHKSLLLRAVKKVDTAIRMQLINKYLTDGNIVISRFLEKYYKEQKNLRIPPLVDLDDKKWECLAPKNNNGTKFIFFGTVGGKKEEISLVLKFFDIISETNKNCRLDIFGITKKELMNLGTPNNSNVKAHGRVSHKEALVEVSKSNFSIFFRENNLITRAGFPTKFVESMSAGTPVITNYSSNLKDYLIHGKNGYAIDIQKLKSNSFTEIKKLEIIESDTESMGIKAFETAENNFHYVNYINLMDEFLKAI